MSNYYRDYIQQDGDEDEAERQYLTELRQRVIAASAARIEEGAVGLTAADLIAEECYSPRAIYDELREAGFSRDRAAAVLEMIGRDFLVVAEGMYEVEELEWEQQQEAK